MELTNDASEMNNNVERLNRVSRMTEIEDLQAPREPSVAPLCIKVCFFVMDSMHIARERIERALCPCLRSI